MARRVCPAVLLATSPAPRHLEMLPKYCGNDAEKIHASVLCSNLFYGHGYSWIYGYPMDLNLE
jgi:hypothetical protein